MTAARLPMIIVLLGSVATATAATSRCAASVAGVRIPPPALHCRRSSDAAKPRFASLYRPFTALSRSQN
jgi:hypothetical protein